MGIPYYFKYLTQKYPRMVTKTRPSANVDYLFMDCNSIVYDVVNDKKSKDESIHDESVITQVIFRIWEYIQKMAPKRVLFIAFDGVAPMSKMQQQRKRRYKTAAIATAEAAETEAKAWSTTCITPGTPFMEKLSTSIKEAFTHKEREIGVDRVILSTSEEVGEGEHKLFQWLRLNNNNTKESISLWVYGMDADLIMLSLLHLPHVDKCWVFREEIKVEEKDKDKDKETVFVDILQLGAAIRQEMNLGHASLREYIFLCFFLGNDFLPHFPCMNIRTHGIPALLEVYRSINHHSKNGGFVHSTTGQINWNFVKKFIEKCAKCEHEWLLQEYEVRAKMEKNIKFDLKNIEDNAPILLRGVEMYIQPRVLGWQQRYYESLFEPATNTHHVVANYLEGLQWVHAYYNFGCPDWKWHYRYNYPPLFHDLAKSFHVPKPMILGKPFTPQEQLAYVMPPNHQKWEIQYQWSFCRYLWEAHIILK